jgi:molybdate transport system ATP-binding protein
MEMKLALQNIQLSLAAFDLKLNITLFGWVTVLFGPSGAGKTTLLDLIAGLRRPRTALIQLDNQVLTDTAKGIFVPPRQRAIGYVPQDLALFPHLSVRSNLRYGEKKHGPSGQEDLFTFERIVQVLEMESLLDRRISELSGGEKQRVALGRALLSSPRLLLLDEPLASLDNSLKAKILPYFRRIRHEFQVPIVYVTHDRVETLALADDILVLLRGQVAQAGPVQEVFSRPANLAVAGLLAVETVQPGQIKSRADGLVVVSVGLILLTAGPVDLPSETSQVHVCIRAEDVILLRGTVPTSARNHLPATVCSVTNTGPMSRVELDCGFPLTALLTRQACEELALQAGEFVIALIKAPQVHLIPR